jgi:hypothetical protein
MRLTQTQLFWFEISSETSPRSLRDDEFPASPHDNVCSAANGLPGPPALGNGSVKTVTTDSSRLDELGRVPCHGCFDPVMMKNVDSPSHIGVAHDHGNH